MRRIAYPARMKQRTGSVLCPNCRKLVGVSESVCPFCGQPAPGMFGYGPALQRLARGFELPKLVIGTCVAMYVVSLLLDPTGIFRMQGMFDFLSPSNGALFLMGMTGRFAIEQGRWWTVLTAIFLHGSLLHVLFNMAITSRFLPEVVELYGAARAWIIFTIAGTVGFGASILAANSATVGASGSVFGLFAGLIVYGRRTRQHVVTQQLWTMAILMFLIGFINIGGTNVDIFAHAGGFAGGFVAAEFMKFSNERPGLPTLVLAWGLAILLAAAFVMQGVMIVRLFLGG
jgi:rhomboid protease GluP